MQVYDTPFEVPCALSYHYIRVNTIVLKRQPSHGCKYLRLEAIPLMQSHCPRSMYPDNCQVLNVQCLLLEFRVYYWFTRVRSDRRSKEAISRSLHVLT
ncbi:hypothetical protein PAXRUDRAFT_695751 [Paxillus rubicundulus Ve08.2h10]|uniref:Uncharacterized protein n=1 Tax=Paxillus rubicundulus Ve08.2h10 TaxID=930991 RepID=A0A0D0EBX0_9AGAM|nr:hypothetical protein PAXRUDRAFT_695751 [Paxillus rubicundulus Ve08.2h10]